MLCKTIIQQKVVLSPFNNLIFITQVIKLFYI